MGIAIGILTEVITDCGITHPIGPGALVGGCFASTSQMLPFCF